MKLFCHIFFMNLLLKILQYRTIEKLRQIKENFFTLFILGPAILTFVYLIAEPYMKAVVDGIYRLPSEPKIEIFAVSLILLLLLSPISSVANEFYPTQSADSYLDTLAIDYVQKFLALLIIRVTKNIPTIFLLFALEQVTAIKSIGFTFSVYHFTAAFVILVQLSVSQILIVLLAAHFGFLRLTRLLPLIGIFFLIFLLSINSSFVTELLLLPFAGLKEIVEDLSVSFFTHRLIQTPAVLFSLALSIVYFTISLYFYKKWAIIDREVVEKVLGQKTVLIGIKSIQKLMQWLKGQEIASQVVRDLILTFRFFSSAVYVSIAIAVLTEIGLIVYAFRYSNKGLGFEIAVQAATALATFSLSSLAPALIKYQLPFFHLERSFPAKPEQLYQSKLIYGRIVALPGLFITLSVAFLVGQFELNAALFLILKTLLVWLLVASFVGALVFEITSRPTLAIPFVAIASLSIATLIIRVWWLWFFVYPYIIDKLHIRGRERAYILLMGIEEENE